MSIQTNENNGQLSLPSKGQVRWGDRFNGLLSITSLPRSAGSLCYRAVSGAGNKCVDVATGATNAYLNGISSNLNDEAPELFKNCSAAIHSFEKAVQRNAPSTELHELATKLIPFIDQIEYEQATLFSRAPLRPNDLTTLKAFKADLEQFSPTHTPPIEQFHSAMSSAQGIINHHLTAQAGPLKAMTTVFNRDILEKLNSSVNQAVQKIDQTVEQALKRTENVPRNMYDNLMGTSNPVKAEAPVERQPAVQAALEQENGSQQVSIGSYLNRATEFLKPYLGNHLDPLSQKAVAGISGALILALESALASIEGKENYQTPREKIGDLIAQLTRLRGTGSVVELYHAIQGSLAAIETHKIYVNGIKLPGFGASSGSVQGSENAFLHNIATLQKAEEKKALAPLNDQQINWKAKAEQEMDEFVDNTTKYLAMKLIYEHVCGLTSFSDQFYFNMISRAKKKANPNGLHNVESHEAFSASLKEAFFKQLEKEQASPVKRVIALVAYPLFSWLLKGFIENLCTTYLKEAFTFIEKNKEDDFRKLKNMLVKNFTRYLEILGGVYERVANNPKPTKLLSEMVQEELKAPDSNLGHETSDLYASLAREVIDKSTRSRFVSWLFRTLIGNEEKIVQAILDEGIGSIMDAHGYTHALNCVLVDELREVLRKMEEKLCNDSQEGLSLQKGSFSKHKKMEIKALVKNLFEILKKSQCQTKDELKDLISGKKSISQNVQTFADDLFMPDAIESITAGLSDAISSFINEQQLHQLTYKFTHLVNAVYEEGKSFTLQEVHAKEKELTELIDCLINLSILTAVEEGFDFTGSKQQRQTNNLIGGLKQKTEVFVESASNDLGALASTHDVMSKESRTRIKKIARDALSYQEGCASTSSEIKGSHLNSDNKKELKNRYDKMAVASSPYVTHIAAMRTAQKEIKEYNKLQKVYENMMATSQSLSRLFITKDTPHLAIASNEKEIVKHMLKLEAYRKEIEELQSQPELTQGLKQLIDDLSTTLHEWQRQLPIIRFIQKELSGDSILTSIVEEMKQISSASIPTYALSTKFEQLKEELAQLNDPDFSKELEKQIEAVQTSTSLNQLQAARIKYQYLCELKVMKIRFDIENKQTKALDYSRSIQIKIQQSFPWNMIEQREHIIRKSIEAAQKSIDSIRASYQGVDPQLTKAEGQALALKDAIQSAVSVNNQNLVTELFTTLREVFNRREVLFTTASEKAEMEKTLSQVAAALIKYIKQTRRTAASAKEETLTALNSLLEKLKDHRAEHEKNNPFRSIAYMNMAAVNVDNFKHLATGLVFGRVKEKIDGLMDFIRREETYRYGIAHHMLLIPYFGRMKASS